MYSVDGDSDIDLDSLSVLFSRMNDAILDFLAEPHVDELAEISMWTGSAFRFCSELEDCYGFDRSREMVQRAWREVRSE